ncbi:MAG: MBL fold metallo-hydrolase [Vallitalea sp.]|nr:MBL fold metallo-hydrolase [Vallitalea sp.]
MLKQIEVYVINTRMYNFSNYCYLVKDINTGKAIIIDPSWDIRKIENMINKTSVSLNGILVTHSHFDHVNLINKINNKYDVPVYIGKKEAKFYNVQYKNLQLIEHRDVIMVGNIKIQCLVTPGHTAGSVCYIIDNNVFTGDTVFIEGCGICDTHGGSAEAMFNSIQFLKNSIPITSRIYPGHCYGKETGQLFSKVLKNNIYFNINNQKQFVDFRLRKNQKNLFSFK